jgi:hypothetical protein
MGYVGIDIEGARALGAVLRDTATRTEAVRQDVLGALKLTELTSRTPLQLALVQDGFVTLASGVTSKAELAEQFAIDPKRAAATLGATEADLGSALAALLGFASPRDLRAVLVGLPPAGADAALDAALARLSPALMPAFVAGKRPELTAEQLAAMLPDLQALARALGIEHVGPPGPPPVEEKRGGFLGLFRRRVEPRTTEVFWHDFWSDGRTVAEVLADPGRLLDWVAGTFEQDRRLSRAVDLPQLGDMLASHDFATANGDPATVAAMIAAAETEFAAIARFLPAFLAGRTTVGPDATQLAQTLTFAARVGWVDPGEAAATPDARFASAIAFLRANRMLQSALLPTGFETDTDPFAFFNAAGIALTLEFGRESGVITDAYAVGVADLATQLLARAGANLASTTPIELTGPVQQQLFALVASQLPRSLAQSPSIQAQFVGALSYLRGAADGPQLRARVVEVVAAFRTLATVGAPALTERELTAVVGANAVDTLGRARLRMRGTEAVDKSPEFLILARQWGIPASRTVDLGKRKFGFAFDQLGVLTTISLKKKKKKGFFSRVFDTIKNIGKAIEDAWEDNPLKAIFQVGKIALGVASLVVPGLQAVGIAALAVNAVEAVSHAIDGNWLGAIGAGLSAFTAGVPLLGDLVDVGGTLQVLRNAKRAFDIGTSVIRATQADNLVEGIGAGLGAVASTLGNGGQLLGSLKLVDPTFAAELVRLGTSVRDIARLVGPGAGLVAAVDRGDALGAIGNGLGVISAGASALGNTKGVRLFEFDAQDRQSLASLATGTGIIGGVARAIAAADAGRPALALQALGQAAQAADRTSQGAVVAQRIAEVGIVIEGVFNGADPRLAAPVIMQRLDRVVQSLKPPGGQQAANPFDPDVGAAANTLIGGAGADVIPVQAPGGGGDGRLHIEMPDGTVFSPVDGLIFVPPGSKVTTPDGTFYHNVPGGNLPSKATDELVPGLGRVPGRVEDDILQLPGLRLFFPAHPDAVPMSRLPEQNGEGFVVADVFGGQTLAGDGLDRTVADELARRLGLHDPPFTIPRPADEVSPFEMLFGPPRDDHYVFAASRNPAFVIDEVLDGGSLTRELIVPFGGLGLSVDQDAAALNLYYGEKLGVSYDESDDAPADGLTVTGSLSLDAALLNSAAAVGVSSEVNFGPLLELRSPTSTGEWIYGVDVMDQITWGYTGAIDGKDDLRPVTPDDFPDFAIGAGPTVMGGLKVPLPDPMALYAISLMTGESPDDILLAREVPDGTGLTFDVREEFQTPFDPGFAGRPGLAAPSFVDTAPGSGGAPPLSSFPVGETPDAFASFDEILPGPDTVGAYRQAPPGPVVLSDDEAIDAYFGKDYLDRALNTMIALEAPEGSAVDFAQDDDFWQQFQPSLADDAGVPPLLGPALDDVSFDSYVPGTTVAYDDEFAVEFDPGFAYQPGFDLPEFDDFGDYYDEPALSIPDGFSVEW